MSALMFLPAMGCGFESDCRVRFFFPSRKSSTLFSSNFPTRIFFSSRFKLEMSLAAKSRVGVNLYGKIESKLKVAVLFSISHRG